MATLESKTKYHCFNDCEMSGCPSHEMKISIQTTSDALTVYRDGKLWFGADPSEWKKLKELLKMHEYYNFDLA